MAENTEIAWCDSTFNPWIGCTKVGPGCDNCYAEADFDLRRHRVKWGAGQERSRTSPANWKKPLQWNAQPFVECMSCGWRGELREAEIVKNPPGFHPPVDSASLCPGCHQPMLKAARRRVFCASLADVFDNEVPAEWRDDLFGLIAATPNLDWLVLTKRIGNAREYITDATTPLRVDTMKHVILAGRLDERNAPERTAAIPGWPGYFITSKGRALSDRTNAGLRGSEQHEVKPQAGESGHARVMLQVEGRVGRELVHRLVLSAFDRAPRGDEQGCHIDGDPSNNALWNLRWGDQGSNWDDSKRHGTRRRYSKLTPEAVALIRCRADAGETGAAIARDFGISDTQARNIIRGDQWKPEQGLEWPLPSMWLGATVCNQEEADRDISKLLQVPARVRWLSMEPLLGPVNLTRAIGCKNCGGRGYVDVGEDEQPCDASGRGQHAESIGELLSDLDWVVVGGESGTNARPMHPAWARSLRDQCAVAGVPFLFKQWGEWRPFNQHTDINDNRAQMVRGDGAFVKSIIDPDFNAAQWMFRCGKKLAGRLLDGVQHDGYPEAKP